MQNAWIRSTLTCKIVSVSSAINHRSECPQFQLLALMYDPRTPVNCFRGQIRPISLSIPISSPSQAPGLRSPTAGPISSAAWSPDDPVAIFVGFPGKTGRRGSGDFLFFPLKKRSIQVVGEERKSPGVMDLLPTRVLFWRGYKDSEFYTRGLGP